MSTRSRRLRAPLVLVLAALLAFEAIGGWVIFCARLVAGTLPGETPHVLVGLALTVVYAIYQWRHLARVWPFRPRLDYALGLLASATLVLTQATGLVLGLDWWRGRSSPGDGPVGYAPLLSAAHNIGGMLVLTFVGAHLGAVLMRDARARHADRASLTR